MRIVLFVESQEANSLGRAYCLWLLARALEWDVTVLTAHGDKVWTPLAGSEFASMITRVRENALFDAVPADAELLIAVKPLPASLGRAHSIAARRGLPLLVDIDDPDLEVRRRAGSPLLAALRCVRRPLRSLVDSRLHRIARDYPSLVSNPWLQHRYGGALIPHTRGGMEPGPAHTGSDLRIAFVGTRHPHKGVDVLREAVASLRSEGHAISLIVTDDPPDDARAWETWIGSTSLEDGLRLTRDTDAVVLPSLRRRQAIGQLPVKLIDAMMLGRAIIVSDVAPLPWAIGDAGMVVAAGDLPALRRALLELCDPELRQRLGDRAVVRAEEEFSLRALAPRFETACRDAVQWHMRRTGKR